MIKQDQLWPGGFRFFFDDGLFQPGTDSFLLGSFPRLRKGLRGCDLGAGTGLLGLLLLAREPNLHVTNVELQPPAVALAEENAALIGHIYAVIAKLAKEMGFADGYRVVTNVGELAGQTVKHIHFHVLSGKQLGSFN